MRKINLQMFAYDPNSIVDYLKSTGQDSSYSARKELAKSLGISNYSGSGAQNTQMLNALKNSAASSTASSKPSSSGSSSGSKSGSSGSESPRPKGAPADAPSYTTTGKESNYYTKEDPYVVPSTNKNVETSTKEITPFTQSGESQSASQNAKDKLAALDKFDVDNIISQETWDAINTPFNASTAYQDAMNLTNQLREQLTSGRTSFTDQIKDLLDQIQNRDKFSYDMSNDTLFQQSLASAMASGKTAMQDTMGQASALTGGYGSTYATSAANQQYNAFIQDAYNNLPEYYELALQAYEMEGNEMYNQLSALSTEDAKEYDRMYNAYNANFQNAQTMYQNEYTAWQDSVNTAIKNAGLQMDEFSTKYDQAYNTYQANQNYADTLYAQEFNKWSAEEDLGLSYAQLAQDQKQFDAQMAYKKTSGGGSGGTVSGKTAEGFDTLNSTELNNLEKKIASVTGYDNKLKAANTYLSVIGKNINPETLDNIISGVVEPEPEFSELSAKDLEEIDRLFIQSGGGDAGYEAVDDYLTFTGNNNVDNAVLDKRLSNLEIPMYYKDWTIANDTFNWFGNDDGNDKYTSGDYSLSFNQLKDIINKADISDGEKQRLLKKLRDQNNK